MFRRVSNDLHVGFAFDSRLNAREGELRPLPFEPEFASEAAAEEFGESAIVAQPSQWRVVASCIDDGYSLKRYEFFIYMGTFDGGCDFGLTLTIRAKIAEFVRIRGSVCFMSVLARVLRPPSRSFSRDSIARASHVGASVSTQRELPGPGSKGIIRWLMGQNASRQTLSRANRRRRRLCRSRQQGDLVGTSCANRLDEVEWARSSLPSTPLTAKPLP